MNKMASLNNKETLLAITSYPNPKDGTLGKKEFNAVSWHSQKTLSHLSTHAPVLVLAESRPGKKSLTPSSSLRVERVWEKGNLFSIFSLLQICLRLSKIKNIFVQFEFNVFGGIIPNLVLLFNLFVLRLLGRHVTFELHQVITDISLLQKHINIKNPAIQYFFNFSLKMFYFILGKIANNIIVFEEELKNRLSSYVTSDKIQVLSLSVDNNKIISQEKARKATNLPKNDFILLVFGFINGYKGIDWIIDAFKYNKDKNLRLVIAGGENPYLKDKPHYQAFYQKIVSEAKKYPHVTLTGFVPDEKIHEYFAASDLVVMPYEVFMAASGPFSLTLSFKKPILLSRVLSNYAKSEDFSRAMKENNLSPKDLFFSFSTKSLLGLVERARTDKVYMSNLQGFVNTLKEYRSSESVVKKLFHIISNTLPSLSTAMHKEKSFSIR